MEKNKSGDRFALEFRDILYDVKDTRKDSGNEYLRLINGFNGKFESGKLSAIMGPSGSCKTSFLNLLVGNNQKNSLTCGEVLYCGKERDAETWHKEYAYLEQDDVIIPEMTSFEFIKFYVRCKLLTKSEKEINYMVKDMMDELGILHIKDTLLKKVSGGERKRVMLTIEMVLETNILILDEPTSGLDSHLALKLLMMLRNYAVKKNKIVIMTIHQPGSGLFNLIDNLLFIHKGLIIYDGPVKNLEQWFEANKLTISNNLSDSEFLFELFTGNSSFSEVRSLEPLIKKIVDEKKTEANNKYGRFETKKGTYDSTTDYKINFNQVKLLIERAWMLMCSSGKLAFLFKFLSVFFLFILALIMIYSLLMAYLYMRLINVKDFNYDTFFEEYFSRKYIFTPFIEEVYKTILKGRLYKFENNFPVKDFYTKLIMPYIFFNIYNLFSFFNVEYITTFPVFSLARLEISKHYYSYTTFYFARLLIEFIIDIWKYVIFTILCFYMKFFDFFSVFEFVKILLLLMFFSLSLKIFNAFICAISEGKFINNLVLSLYLIMHFRSCNFDFIFPLLPKSYQSVYVWVMFLSSFINPVPNAKFFMEGHFNINIGKYILDYINNNNSVDKYDDLKTNVWSMIRAFTSCGISYVPKSETYKKGLLLLGCDIYLGDKKKDEISEICDKFYRKIRNDLGEDINFNFSKRKFSYIYNGLFSVANIFLLVGLTLLILKIRITRNQKLKLSN